MTLTPAKAAELIAAAETRLVEIEVPYHDKAESFRRAIQDQLSKRGMTGVYLSRERRGDRYVYIADKGMTREAYRFAHRMEGLT